MNYYDVKFSLNFDKYDYSKIKYIFNNARSALNWQFDENFNAKLIDGDIDYQIRDVSNLERNEIDKIIDSFFRFSFDEIINVPLYKFLVLKNNNELKILANINSLIFDYSSINDFYELFKDLNKSYPKKELDTYYGDIKDYLNSSNFKKDSQYWTKYIFNSNNYINFYNLKNNVYKSRLINVDKDSVFTFIENHDCSLFDFYGSVFSLYLSRINRIGGCLLKSIIPHEKSDSRVFDKTTLLKIDANNDDSFNELLNVFCEEFKNALNHTTVDVENYLDENASYYSIYDFNDLNENIRVFTGEYSALTLNIYENSLELTYNCDLFSDVYMEHMAKNIESLINNVLSSPNHATANVDILSNEEKALLSDYCKGISIEVKKDKTLSQSFREHALANPDAIAVDDGVNQISYGELEKSSNSIAKDLYENHNIGPGSHVALMLHRNYHFSEFVLALNKIGATYVPIDLLFPVNRIEHMLNISETDHLITTETIAKSLDLNVNIISIEDLNYDNDVDVEILAKSDDLFAILFTSGTTGIPKGVMFQNKQVPWFSASFADMFNFTYGDVVGSYFSFSFVASFLIFVSLYLGGSVRLFNENEQKNSLLLIKGLKETHINNLILPPSVGVPIFENEDLNLDYLILAGAKLNKLTKKDRHTKLVNFYGTTEVLFAISKIYDLNDIEDDRVPIGRPVANSWTYILDENGNQMPIGVPGEICISSAGITQGYYNDSQSTSKVYMDNPFCDNEINKRMYCTGDIGFYNFDGEIEIIGRDDDQLSVRGFRVESKEILTIMKGFEEISDIYLDVDYDNLIAYYTTIDDLDINEVKEALKTELPYYMVPSLFIELEKIPLNINGKIDKSSLKVVTDNENIEISDEVLSCIVDAFKEVLNRDVVLIDDDFVSLGGNSLSAMKLQLLLKEKLDVSLSSNELIDLSTPQDIANHIKFNLNIHSTIDEEKYTFDNPCPLSESQLNVYLDESVNDMGTAYNNSFKIDFKDNYSVSEIKDALMKLFEAFPILKARVLNNNDVLSFVFDAEPEIIEGSLNDIQSFVKPFEFDKYLSRFLVVEDNASIILCADFHHLIFDGTSLNILLNKLSSILENEYTDFIDKGVLRQASFEEIIGQDYMDDAHKFFENMLADREEVYELLPSLNGNEDEFELIDTFDIDIENLNSFLQNNSITYNQFFTSVFAYTLSRFTGSDKVLFNIIENGRGHIDLSQSVGMFVKTLPLLMDCKNQDIASYLEYSSKLINSVMKYDLYPFRSLASDYNLNSNILFQYSHDLFSDVINKEDLKYIVDELDHDLNADLSFYIFNNGENRLTIRILYSSRYSKNFIGSFIESYKLILQQITNVELLEEITYITNEDIEILDSYNQTENKLSYDDILDAFNDNLSKYPDNTFVSYNDVSYTFAEGAFITDRIAKCLIELGVNAQDCVGFLLPRNELYALSILGIMSMGAVYVPLDENLPDERVDFMIKDTQSKVLIVSDETYRRGCDLDNDCIILNISEIINSDIKTLDKLNITYGNLACILYTSGSTGLPKGVKITHKSILNFIDFHVNDLNILKEDVYGLFASIGFDVAMAAIFSAAYTGCCVNVIPDDIRLNIKALNNHFVKYGVTHTYITTQVAKLFIQEIESTSLKVLVAGGEKLGEISTNRHYRIVDAYGPTEACVYVISAATVDKIDSSSVGYVQNNTKAYILDNEKRRVPIGCVGELYLSGHQLADGYLNREKETKDAFMNNPFDENPDYNRLYRTGDMVRLLPDKTYGIIGRRDNQVKIRGNRVELPEIEAIIRGIDFVDDITVQTIEKDSNVELVAYVVVSNGMNEDNLKSYIQDYVRDHKPDYMVPPYVVKLNEIPLNVNGKVDKNALPDVDSSSLHAEYVAPTTEDEKIIVKAFEKVFNQKIGINDDFIRLGGDSLTAIKLLSHLEGYNITAVDILSLHTPYAIAKNIKKTKLDLDIYTLENGCPLSESQLNIYLDIEVNNKDDAYTLPIFIEIPKKYGVNEIFDALNKIFETHPILSMCISDEFEVPYLVKGSNPSIIVENDVSDDFIIEFINMPFDLQDSLCRFLITKDNDNYKLFGAFNHIIFDRLSTNVFKRNLQAILDGESISVDESFLKVSAFSQQIKNTDEYANAKNFYESMLIDNEESSTLMDSIDSNEQGQLKIDLDLDINSLKSFLEKHGVSENVLFTAAFAYTLSHFTGYETASFNLVENGRDRFNNFSSIGMYVNTLPILVNCKNQNVASFIENTAGLIYDVMRYNYYPFRLLANEYNINSDILFQFLPEWIGNNEKLDKNSLNDNENKIITQRDNLIADFIVEVTQSGEEYNLNITYCDKYSKDFIERFGESYKLIVRQITNVEILEEITYITQEDIEILDSYNQTEKKLSYEDILDAFNDNLSKYPDNTFLSYNDVSYTFAEGAFIADRIAKCLIELGVNAQDCVGFLLPRSELYALSILGIMSMGAFYVPIDENLPDERAVFMIKDTQSKVLIVSDETYGRGCDLYNDCIILNISDIINSDIGTLDKLNITYGDLICILYTSGSTGLPKGVKIKRKSVLNFIDFHVNDLNISKEDVYGLFTSIGFDVAMGGIFSAIYAGCCLNIIPEDIRLNIQALNNHFIKHGVTHTAITTQVAKLFIQEIETTSLKVLVAIGEKLGEISENRHYTIVDAYGPTEACVYVTSAITTDKIDPSSVGYVQNNTKAYILDNEKRRVPIGCVGELYLSGHQLADGYLNREKETKDAFINNPFEENPNYNKLYRTGDMVRLLPDKTYGIVGRRDNQVKIRGNRVELSEVESAIRELDYVDDVTVQTVKNGDNYELVAYVVLSNEFDGIIEEEIQNHVGEIKPEYMIPSFIIKLDEIPLTINSKVDKNALPDVDLESLHVEYVAPRNEIEGDIVNAFEKVFNQDKIGVYDDFVRLGGDSLTAIKLLNYLKDYNVSVADVLSLRTPYAIADNINEISFDLDVYSLDSGCPLSESQLNVYLDIVANNKKDAYLIPVFMDISNKYGAEDIVDALNEMFCVHPILGMCVSDSFDVPYLVKGLKPSISIESDVDDEFIVDFLTQHFDLMKSLSRFLIIKNDDNYSLYAVFHHIIFDALSDEVFKKDLQIILDGGIVDIDDSFLKISAFNQQLQKTEDYLEAEKFFNSMLVDSDDVGVLLDSVLSDGSGHYLFDLDLDYDLFNSFLETYNVSANILFSSVFAYTLSRFVGSDKVLFNIVENGRDRFVNYDSIGMFVNTLPLLVDCENQDVQSFMEYVSEKVYGVMKYNYYPFRLLANKYDINSDILFQYIPEWIKDANDFDEIESNNELISNMDDLIADLTVEIIQRGNKHILSITYSEKYSKDFISHFIESYKLILENILNVNELSEINYISDRDIGLLDSYNWTEHDLIYSDILDAFNDNLSRCPDNALVRYNDVSYSYSEGAFIASRIAELLIDLGVESQDCVGFLVPRSELYMFSVLGILSIGGVYVPFEDNHPDERINFILIDSETKVVIVVDETYDRAKSLFDDDVILLNISNIVNGDVGSLSVLPANYGDLACILYTSGTTGIPKGVKVKRKALLNVSSDYVDKYDLGAADVYALFSSIGFDVSSFVICAVIRSGACLSVIPDDIRLNMSAMNEYFIKQGVTHAFITTQVGKLFVQTVDNTSLKVLLVAGEKLGEFESPKDYLLIDAYGPTEAFAFNTSVDNNVKIDGSSVGMLNYNTSAYVLDNEFRRVPFGAVGELYLAGYQVADGYLNREEENTMAFIENPFSNEEGYNTLYRTGDLVRILPDGSLGIVGRSDSQVKIRGNRVELGEVEAVIRQMDNILDVTVQTVKIKDNDELVAYVVSDESDKDTIGNAIQEYVGEVQPDYMIPSFVICLDHIPLTVNGKVNRSALPEVDMDSLSVEYVAPTSKTEEQIVHAYEVVFNQKDIGLNDDFTRLGGDSITAIRLISLLEKDGISCSARDILNYKTPYLIAKNIQTVESISYDAVEGNVNLLPIQEYFFDQINKDNFTQSFVLKLKEKIDKNILQESFNELCNIHDMLRANYSFDENGNPIQEILPVGTEICKINEHTISDNFEESLKDIYIKSSDSINKQNKLIEINLINHNSDLYIMFIIHHLIVDGVSWNILISDLTQIYHNLNEEKEIEVTRPYPYKNWVENVKNLAEDISSDEKEHWIKINSSLDDSAIKGDTKAFAFDVDVNYDVDNLLMLTEEEYWALAIARAYKKTYGKDIIFNRETHGRDESIAKLNRTIGWFTSQYPILVNTNNDYDDISLMKDVYNIKTAFKDVNNLGLNYASLVYTNKEFKFKHCPVTFNFLSSEFTFENELFKSIMQDLSLDYNAMNTDKDSKSYGATFNVSNQGNSYIISGEYANNTYIGYEFDTFLENIKSELEFIGNFNFKNENIICCLSESQLGVYLDEKANEKGTAYSTAGIFEYDSIFSTDEIKEAIHALINKHPILRGRILDTDSIPLLICDNNPSIETVNNADYHDLIKAFDLDKSLARFFIVNNEDSKFVFYDIHHIISDATTLTLINKELEQALIGQLDDEIDLGFAYASRDSFESKYDYKYKSAHKFFHDAFADIDEVRYILDDVDGSKGSVSLPIRGIREKVESFVQKQGITISNLLNAVFAYTYSRFTGSNKVYYNFTEHGRHESYLQDAWGMFIRTIPILVDCENKSVRDFVDYMSDLTLKSMTNSSYPFRLLVREFNLNNKVLFEYNHNLNDFNIGNDMVVRDDADGVSEFLCVVNDLEDGFVVTISHLDKFSQDTAKQFVKVFKEILIQFLEKDELKDINYISDADIGILDTLNQTEHPLEHNDILEAFNVNLSKYPDNKLVSFNEKSYSYAECAFIADKIAKSLKDYGVETGDYVPFLVKRSELYMLSILAIMSVGAVYVPLDDAHPDNRIEFMIEDTASKAIIADDNTLKRVKSFSNDVDILNISDILKEDLGSLPNLPVVYNELACILYTSGTTGVPKGVKITRKSLLNVAESYIENYGLSNNDVYGLFSSIGFDVSSFVISVVMCACACLSVIPEDIRLNMPELNNYFMKQNVSHAFITTQVGKLFMQSVDDTSLDVLLVAGEKLGEFESPKNYRLVDAYGPTEAFAFVSSIDNASKLDASSVGMLNHNTHAYILDDEKRRVPCGAVGELYLSGFQIADGYLNRPEENADAFIDNPFDNENYDIMYRTGDMVRLLPDGSLAIVGRSDSQVKIRGNRVELSEIESVIRELDYVEDVTVQTVENKSNIELVAYVVVSNGMDEKILEKNIQDYVRQQKPEYMVPSFVIALEEIPLNVNGKVDKHALPDVDRTSLHVEYAAPRNENEKEIVKAFENALNLEKVGIHDDFIRLGGDSLTAIKLLSHIQSNDITMADILTFRTPEAIAKNMSDFSFDLDLYTIESGCPLNAAQLNVFADVTIYNKRDAYHIPGYIPISKEHSLEDIQSALDEMLKVHPILGMHLIDMYEENNSDDIGNLDIIRDLITTAKKFGIKEILSLINAYGLKDLGGIYNMIKTTIRLFKGEYPYIVKGEKPQISVKSEFDTDTIIEFLAESLDIYNNLSKFMIVETEESYYLFYVIHHLIFDAVSAGVFKHDFEILLDGGSVKLDDTFLKASAYTQQIKNTDKFEEASEYYHPILSSLDDVGTLSEDNSSEGYSTASWDLKFDKTTFKSFLNNAGISENVLFTSVFAYALSQFVDEDKVIFTLIENGRDRFNENFIGMTSNVMPLVADCNDRSINSFMKDMADAVYGISRHSYYPILLLYQKYNFEVNTLFQFVPNWIADDFDVEDIDDIDTEEIMNYILDSYGDYITEFFVQIYQNGENYRILITNSNKFSNKLIEDFKDTYISILSNIINTDINSNLNSTLK
ncbi:amino acid adenylation domain-containing protein [Methanobrevibacter sp.]|uniref:amino acid adenylation domain-containing protein n=1 Tax=Methanobrevibacter sp. TaxID=66852 RepID=UPI0038905653